MKLSHEEKFPKLDYPKEAKTFNQKFAFEVPPQYLKFPEESGAGIFPSPCLFDWVYEIGTILQFGNGYEENSTSYETDLVMGKKGSKTIDHGSQCNLLWGII